MIRHIRLLALCVFVAGCQRVPRDAQEASSRATQVSVINALMLGQYDGVVSIGELLSYGDFGVGTLDHLDGELIVVDGRAYQVRGDGRVLSVPSTRSTPFATVVQFRAQDSLECPKANALSELDAFVAGSTGHANSFVALRVETTFDSITLRSVDRQEPPYRPLGEVAKEQNEWTHQNVRGTLVGIRAPQWVSGLNVPGTHWHFLSDDRRVGGHVLDCTYQSATVRYQVCDEWLIKFDRSRGFDTLDLRRDQSAAVHEVESARRGQE